MYMMINFSVFHHFSLSQEQVRRRDCVVNGTECNWDFEGTFEKLKTTSFPWWFKCVFSVRNEYQAITLRDNDERTRILFYMFAKHFEYRKCEHKLNEETKNSFLIKYFWKIRKCREFISSVLFPPFNLSLCGVTERSHSKLARW